MIDIDLTISIAASLNTIDLTISITLTCGMWIRGDVAYSKSYYVSNYYVSGNASHSESSPSCTHPTLCERGRLAWHSVVY